MEMLLVLISTVFGVSIEVYFIVLILAIPLFFFWRRLLRPRIRSRPAVVFTAGVATFFTAPFLYASLVMLWVAVATYYPRSGFNRAKWLSNKEERYKLSEDIIESKMLLGKTKLEVRQVLGEDESTNDESDYWRYYLGFKPSVFGIDPDVLDIYFKNGKVVKVGQHET